MGYIPPSHGAVKAVGSITPIKEQSRLKLIIYPPVENNRQDTARILAYIKIKYRIFHSYNVYYNIYSIKRAHGPARAFCLERPFF